VNRNKVEIKVSAEVNTILHDLFNQIQYELCEQYEEEIERLKELCDKYEEEHKTTFKEWQDTIKRIDKAIEYIEHLEWVEMSFDMLGKERIRGTTKDFVNELLDILKGSDKEWKKKN